MRWTYRALLGDAEAPELPARDRKQFNKLRRLACRACRLSLRSLCERGLGSRSCSRLPARRAVGGVEGSCLTRLASIVSMRGLHSTRTVVVLALINSAQSASQQLPVCGSTTFASPPLCVTMPATPRTPYGLDGNAAPVRATPAFLSQGVVNFGQLVESTAHRLAGGHCLRFLALGGSITCGHGTCQGDGNCLADAWPAKVVTQLNAVLPCTSSGGGSSLHNVTNACRPGVSSDTWVEELMASRRENRVWHDGLPYDAVIVETSANDVVDLERHDRNVHHTADMALSTRSARYTELLINLVLSHGNTSVIYVGASTHGNGWMGERPRMSDAVEAQLPVAIHYRIPYVSVIDAIGPLRTTVAKEWYNNDFQPYRGADKLHASNLGHELISTLLSDLLLRHAVTLREPFATASRT